ncbi:MAG: hypothetical protein KF764_11285 [Labilithrix sp.]|nr:hypothetical protein [Labilithrix sp.]
MSADAKIERARPLSADDLARVRSMAATIREAVFRQVDGEAEVIAAKVAEKLRKEEPPVAEPEAVLLSVEQAAKLLGITRNAFFKRLYRGRIPGIVRSGRTVHIHKEKFLLGLSRKAK